MQPVWRATLFTPAHCCIGRFPSPARRDIRQKIGHFLLVQSGFKALGHQRAVHAFHFGHFFARD